MLSRLAPWSGLMAAAICLTVNQQGLTSLLHFDCHAGSATKGLTLFAVLGLVLIVSAVASWQARQGAELKRFIATMSAGAAALVLFAIGLQTAATLILPGCGA